MSTKTLTKEEIKELKKYVKLLKKDIEKWEEAGMAINLCKQFQYYCATIDEISSIIEEVIKKKEITEEEIKRLKELEEERQSLYRFLLETDVGIIYMFMKK